MRGICHKWAPVVCLLCVALCLQMMNNMGGEDGMPDLDGVDDVSLNQLFSIKQAFGNY